MHCIERAPQRVKRFVRRRQNVFFISIRVLFQPPAPGRPMRLVRFFMHLEVRQPFRLSHSVKLLQSINLSRRNLRHL